MAGGVPEVLTMCRHTIVNSLVQNGFGTLDAQALCSVKAINYPRN